MKKTVSLQQVAMKKILSLQQMAASEDDCLVDSTSSVHCPSLICNK